METRRVPRQANGAAQRSRVGVMSSTFHCNDIMLVVHLHYPDLLQRAEPVLYSQSMRPPPLEGPALRVLTWNVASLRSLLKNVRAPLAQSLQVFPCDCTIKQVLPALTFAALDHGVCCLQSKVLCLCKGVGLALLTVLEAELC